MKLVYEGYNKVGRPVRDVIEANGPGEAEAQLRRRGLFITNIARAGAGEQADTPKPNAAAAKRFSLPGGGAKRLRNLALFTRQLYVLSSTGTPLVESLAALERQTREPAWREVISQLKHRVEEGGSLSDAMADHPRYFDSVYRSLVAAGESSGEFEPMLDRLAQLVRKQVQIRGAISGALVYPSLLLTVAGGVLVAMMMFVLPRFAELFDTLDLPLPPSTQMMVNVSDLLLGYWWLMIAGMIGLGFALRWWMNTDDGRQTIDSIMIRLPIFGVITRSFATARITRMLGTLLVSQVSLLEALTLTRDASGNVHYRKLIVDAEEAVTRGDAISSAFANEQLVNPAVYEAIRSGEATGQVGPLLLNVAEFLEEDNEVVLRSMTSILEPVILIVLGLLVGAVALAMFLPLFDLTASAGR